MALAEGASELLALLSLRAKVNCRTRACAYERRGGDLLSIEKRKSNNYGLISKGQEQKHPAAL